MSSTNTSYILSIKVWNYLTNEEAYYDNIGNKVKSRLLEREKDKGLFKLLNEDPFTKGDLAIELPDTPDEKVVDKVCDIMSEFNEELHAQKFLSEYQGIVFRLVKELVFAVA